MNILENGDGVKGVFERNLEDENFTRLGDPLIVE